MPWCAKWRMSRTDGTDEYTTTRLWHWHIYRLWQLLPNGAVEGAVQHVSRNLLWIASLRLGSMVIDAKFLVSFDSSLQRIISLWYRRWVARYSVSSEILFPRKMNNAEVPQKSPLLRRNSYVFGISLRVLSPKTLIRGLWLMTTSNWWQLSVKKTYVQAPWWPKLLPQLTCNVAEVKKRDPASDSPSTQVAIPCSCNASVGERIRHISFGPANFSTATPFVVFAFIVFICAFLVSAYVFIDSAFAYNRITTINSSVSQPRVLIKSSHRIH